MQLSRSLITVSLALAAIQAYAQAPWKIVELKGPAGTFVARAFSVDRNRNVYGQAQMNVGGIRPVRWMAATGYTPEFVGTQDGFARASNNKGYFVGLQEMTGPAGGPSARPIMWSPDGTPTLLEGLPPFLRGEAISINASQMIAGTTYSTNTGGWRPFRWIEGKSFELQALPDLGHSFSTSMNDAGFVVGYGVDNWTAPSQQAGWIWSPTGGLQKLPGIGGYYRANSINNTGLICGNARTSGLLSAVVWPLFGTPTVLTPLTGYPNADAVAVSDLGSVAGNMWAGKWNQQKLLRPVAWIDGVCHDIGAEAPVAGATLGFARGINIRGDVVGEGSFSGRASGFIAIRR